PGMPLVEMTIDGRKVKVPASHTIIQACEMHGVYVPRFCYHDRLSIAGNCRMCLVEVEKSPKPVRPTPGHGGAHPQSLQVASCAMPINPGMVIKTQSPMVAKAREG